MATFAELQTDVIRACALSESDRTDVKRFLNEAMWSAAGELLLRHAESTESLAAGDGDYSLASDFALTDLVAIREVRYGADGYRMRKVDPAYIDELRQVVGGLSSVYVYALAGDDLFRVWPIPTATTSITIRYVARAPAMVADADVPTAIPVEHHEVVRLGACVRAARAEDVELSRAFRADHIDAMKLFNAWLRDRQGSQPSRVRTRTSARPRYMEGEYWSGDS